MNTGQKYPHYGTGKMGNILNIINSDKDFYDTHNGHYMRCAKGAFYSSETKRTL